MSKSKIIAGRIALLAGLLGGFISFWYTLEFTWTPEFAATNLPDGPTHSNYHAFREALLALGVNLLLLWVFIKPEAIKSGQWIIVVFMAGLYYAGWWTAWPIWGYHAPNITAELNHLMGTVGGLVGLYLLKPSQ